MTERMRQRIVLSLVAALVLVLAACSEDKAQAAGKGPAPDDDALIAAWKKAGLEVSPFTNADAAPYSAQTCRAGTVGGVDVTICSYDTGEDAAAAEDPALALLEKGGAGSAVRPVAIGEPVPGTGLVTVLIGTSVAPAFAYFFRPIFGR